MGRRAHALMKPLKGPRNIPIFQKVETVNAPAEAGAGLISSRKRCYAKSCATKNLAQILMHI